MAHPYGARKRFALILLGGIFESLIAVLALSLQAVPLRDLFVVAGFTIYIAIVSFTSDGTKSTARPFKPLAPVQRFIRPMLLISFISSVILPSVWIAAASSKAVVDLLAPHLFLIACQVLFELWSYRPVIPVTIRLFIPVAFNAYRLGALGEWCYRAWKCDLLSMKILAGLNISFWAFGFFYILLIRVLPDVGRCTYYRCALEVVEGQPAILTEWNDRKPVKKKIRMLPQVQARRRMIPCTTHEIFSYHEETNSPEGEGMVQHTAHFKVLLLARAAT